MIHKILSGPWIGFLISIWFIYIAYHADSVFLGFTAGAYFAITFVQALDILEKRWIENERAKHD